MNDKKIITQIEKNYVDTLHLYCNLEDFIDDKNQHETIKYFNMYKYIAGTMLITAEKQKDADGREWYGFDNYRLGIMEYDKAKIANQFNCVILYSHSHIFPLNKNLDGLDLPFDCSRLKYHIKRIDLTKTAKLSTDYTINHGYISPYRSVHPLRPNRSKNTVYLGNRKNGNVFRMYPKTIELKEKKDYAKIALYTEYFGDIENLYSFELELRREYLRDTLGILTLADLSKVWEANKNIVGRIRFFKDTPKNRKLLEQNNHKRIKALRLTEYVDYERVEKKKYKTSYSWHINFLKKEIRRYLDAGLEANEINYYMRLFTDLTDNLDINGKELTFNFENSDLVIDKAQMTAKYKLLRENQDNSLEIESKRHFGVFVSGKKKLDDIKN